MRTLSRGRCFLYVAPCAYEDLVKLGFARDPLVRLRAMHHRFYEFFDIDSGFLVETDTVRESRALETRLKHALAAHNAPAPLIVRHEAAGHSEWYRGAYALLAENARDLSAGGHIVHRPLRPWIERQLLARGPELYSWSENILAVLLGEPTHPDAARLAGILRDMLDGYAALGIPLEPMLSQEAYEWYSAPTDAQ